MDDVEPFEFGDGDRGVILLHGLTGNPYEVRNLGIALAERGFAVVGPRLAGHHSLRALERSTWRDWYASAEEAIEAFRAGGRRKIVVAGFSMGSLLTLRYAALRPDRLEGAIIMSVPLSFGPGRRAAIRWLNRLRASPWVGDAVGVLAKNGRDVRRESETRERGGVGGFPFPSLAQLVELQDEIADLLPHVRTPLLLMHGRFDHTTPATQSRRVAQRVRSTTRLRVLPNSFHQIGLDLDRHEVCRETVEFVTSVLGAPQEDRPDA